MKKKKDYTVHVLTIPDEKVRINLKVRKDETAVEAAENFMARLKKDRKAFHISPLKKKS